MLTKARVRQWYDNVAAAVLTSATISEALNPEQEILTALNQKYDALKDKLILEVMTFIFTVNYSIVLSFLLTLYSNVVEYLFC